LIFTYLRTQTRSLPVALAVGVLCSLGTLTSDAQSQTLRDPGYWSATADRRATVYRFVYRQSPQAVPAGYDPVREAEEILRRRQQSLPSSNSTVRSLWQRTHALTIRSGLSTAPRVLARISLVPGVAYIGWKIGDGINAKFLRFGVPEQPGSITAARMVYASEGQQIRPWLQPMPYDGFFFEYDIGYLTYAHVQRRISSGPPNGPARRCELGPMAVPPAIEARPTGAVEPCYDGTFMSEAWLMPEIGTLPAGPIEDYTGQDYSRGTPAPSPPPPSTVEGSIDNALEQDENGELRQWLNYELGSPGEQDPLGIDEPNPDIEFVDLDEHFEQHGHEFNPPYPDKRRYWRGAADIIERFERGDADIEQCVNSEGHVYYWDNDKGAIVVLKYGKIVTYFRPPSRDYWEEQCNS